MSRKEKPMASKALVLGAATAGGVMIYSGLAGVSVLDVLAGKASLKDADPKGGKGLPENLLSMLKTSGKGSSDVLVSPDALLKGASGGARGIVEQAAAVAQQCCGTYVGSDFRPGSTTTSGNVSDHSGNDANRAARDIGVQGIDLLVGPPSPKLDEAVVRIGKLFGRNYKPGKTIIDTFHFHGYQIQIIWRTSAYGGHMGHIHIGAHKI